MDEAVQVSRLDLNGLIEREWLATNGIGGYAASTIPSLNTRKYHGLLVAAMAPPVRRMVLLSRVEEVLIGDGQRHELACNEYPGAIHPQGHTHLRAFNAHPFPRWAYQCDGLTIEKQLRLLEGENTVVLSYALLAGDRPADLEVRPLFAMRSIHQLMYQWNGRLLAERRAKQHYRIPATSRTPEIFFAQTGEFEFEPLWYLNTIYRREAERGYAGLEDVWSPGVVRFRLAPGQVVHFVCSSDPIDLSAVIDRATAHSAALAKPKIDAFADNTLDRLIRAARQFVITAPPDGSGEKLSDSSVTCIGHYPWGCPSPRAAMIGFGGLFMATGRFAEARSLLLSMAAMQRRGLMPSGFPEDGSVPAYNGADISLWFVNSAWSYLRYTHDDATIRRHLLEPILGVIDTYRNGTDLGIGVDADGLLSTRAPGLPTTWMDAKVNDVVVTARAGKPVEMNALWYNAVCIAAELCQRFDQTSRARELRMLAESIGEGFNRRFWNEQSGSCFDVIDDHGNDSSLRPNQLLAISLPFAVLSIDRQARVLEKVRDELLTPMGIRTLAPNDAAYMGRSSGDVVARDRAQHNGAAHPWLLGPYVSALFRVLGRDQSVQEIASEALESCLQYLSDTGLGQLPELFDGDLPHCAGGAIASAPSIGEILRCYFEDVLDRSPRDLPVPTRATLDATNVDIPAPQPSTDITPHHA
ncbi:MAG TPA: amylo-alpha-1,6-glucosidase [Humisphaera sp.]|nr:amylo-alpha-1,6-glucosidase [Humisphaera sp.]